nr:helix-turn-helix transcriptional regulator [Amycolatopsis nigrescens]
MARTYRSGDSAVWLASRTATRKSESSVRSRELGAELVRIRERAGLTGDALAKILHWSPSKVSRIESGKPGTHEVDVAIYAASCGLKYGELEELLAMAREADTGYWIRPHEDRLPEEMRRTTLARFSSGMGAWPRPKSTGESAYEWAVSPCCAIGSHLDASSSSMSTHFVGGRVRRRSSTSNC